MVSVNDINPFSGFDLGVGAIGNALLLLGLVVVIFGLVGWLVYWIITNKQYKYRIPLYKSINGINLRQATYKAKNIPISKAGDSLWFVKGLKKYIAPATKTDAPNSYPHEEREDGEWINFEIATVNEEQKTAGVKFIQQDMRTQRIATGQILEQRLINKSFWEKYKDMIVHLIFYIIVALLMIVTFWQWGNIVEQIGGMLSAIDQIIENLKSLECVEIAEKGIVPTAALILFRRFKK